MKISNGARDLINKMLAGGENNCIRVLEQKSADSSSIFLTVAKADEKDLREINGVKVFFEDELLERLNAVILYEKDGNLQIKDKAKGGCC
ncbi:MAG: hypothetical protein SPI59_02615 [Finegoldia sp.]|nr:hypothetical protein [Finegoldia sp.]